MNHLVVIVGGTGAGKTFLLSRIAEINKAFSPDDATEQDLSEFPYCVVKKYTTRSPRRNEQDGATDLYCNATDEDFKKCGKFVYTYGNNSYGIDCSEIDRKLANNQSPIIIVRDFRMVGLLKQKYNCVIDIYCKSGLSKEDLRDVLKENGASEDEIHARMSNTVHDDNQWLYSENKFFDYVVNRYDNSFIPAIISSLKRATKVNFNKIAVIAVDTMRMKEIVTGITTVSERSDQFSIQQILANDILNPSKKDEIIESITNSWLTIVDISYDENNEDPHGLYRLVNIVFNTKHGSDNKLILADSSMSQPPFDIFNSRVYFYDKERGNVSRIIRDQLQGIFEIH